MISQGDVELSVISKNFFFTFFNFFILFTILGTASNLVDLLTKFGEKLTSATEIAFALANSLANLLGFYTNFIILQAFGLFPFRLLEFGALSLYPIWLMGAKTPRGKHLLTRRKTPTLTITQTTLNWFNLQFSAMDSSCPRLYSSSSSVWSTVSLETPGRFYSQVSLTSSLGSSSTSTSCFTQWNIASTRQVGAGR